MDNNPKHVAFICDGNRRWARGKGLPAWEGHRQGFKKLQDLADWAKELNIKEMSLYGFSMQNFKRDEKEVKFLMDLFESHAKKFLENSKIHENKVKIKHAGRLDLLPERVQKPMKELIEATKDYNNHTIHLCIAYGGREEIVDGVNKIIKDVKEGKLDKIEEDTFGDYLYFNSDPDLIIRTSGENRTSNFLPWQSTYSEWFFLEKHWPELSKQDLVKCIEEFKEKRNRRFGK